MKYKSFYYSPLGKIILGSDGKNLTILSFVNHRFYNESFMKSVIVKEDLEVFIKTKKWLDKYFKGEFPNTFDIPLALHGSDFRKRIWKLLRKIPYGEVVTYKDLAKEVAKEMNLVSMSSQAVGNAIGHNPISIIIPCHRVVGTNGSLVGYGGGIKNKVKLLELEKVDMSNFYVPVKGSAL